MPNEKAPLTDAELASLMSKITVRIERLQKTLRRLKIIHADVAKFPIAEIDENGRDTVHDEISEIIPTRMTGVSALNEFIKSLSYQYRLHGYSHKSARRLVGIIHLEGNENLATEIRSEVQEINNLKDDFNKELSFSYNTSYQRQEFYRNTDTGVIPKTVTRHVQMAEPKLENVGFSWISKGYQLEKIDHKAAMIIVNSRCEKKVENNEELSFETLLEMDEKKLAPYANDTIVWIRPSKLNPRFVCSYRNEVGKVDRRNPVRATLPLLVISSQPLKKYNQLSDFVGYENLAKRSGAKRIDRVPIIPEYGLFEMNKQLET